VPFVMLARRNYYDLRGIVGDGFLALSRIYATQPERWLISRMARDLDGVQFDTVHYPQWERIAHYSRCFFMRSPWWLGMQPRPESDTGQVRLHVTSIPSRLIRDEDSPAFPREFHYGLVEYALYDLRSQEAETELALQHWQEYKVFEGQLQAYVDGRQATDKVHRMGEERGVF
jgi:hypothetical protein